MNFVLYVICSILFMINVISFGITNDVTDGIYAILFLVFAHHYDKEERK